MADARYSLVVLMTALLGGCATAPLDPPPAEVTDAVPTPHALHVPVFRFAVYDQRMAEFQYIGSGERNSRRLSRQFPNTPGPMPVDCETFVEFGVTLKNRRHKFEFFVTDAWGEPIDERHFTYRRWLRTGSLAGQVRFRDRPDDGVYNIVVTHRGTVLHVEKFRLDGCTDDSRPGTIENLARLDQKGAATHTSQTRAM